MDVLIKSTAILFLFSIFTSIADQHQPKCEINQLKKQIANLQKKIQSVGKEKTTLARRLNNLEKSIISLNIHIKEGENRLQQIEQHSIELNTELQQLIRKKESTHNTLLQLVQSSYILGQQNYIKLLLNKQNPMEVSLALAFYRYFIDGMQDRRREINQISVTLKQEKEKIDKALSILQEDQKFLSIKSQAQRTQLNFVQKKLSEDINLVDIYRKRKKELIHLFTNLQSTVSRVDRNGIPIRHNWQKKMLLTGFENKKGHLSMPSIARVKHRYGEKIQESGLTWKGLMLDVKEGQDVSAIYPGQVIYADWLNGYGLLMVLDHGNDFMSLYGHNKLLHVQLGDSVYEGDIIASAGSTGGLLSPGLYFEIRKNGKPVDPLEWCRL